MSTVTVTLSRTTHFEDDERIPFLIELSRVPCIGELISTLNATKGGVEHDVGFLRVIGVVHLAGSVAALVHTEPTDDAARPR